MRAFILAFILIITAPARALDLADPSLTGLDMLPACKEAITGGAGNLFNQGRCVGIIDSLFFFGQSLPEYVRSCPPKHITGGEVVVAVVERLESVPHELYHVPMIRTGMPSRGGRQT